MAKYQVNMNHGLDLPVLRTLNGELLINVEHCAAQEVVECPQLTEEMKVLINEGKLIPLDVISEPVNTNKNISDPED